MKNKTAAKNKISEGKVLERSFSCFFNFTEKTSDHKTAHKLAVKSYETISRYFHNLKQFQLSNDATIEVTSGDLTDKDILAFSVWMQQYLKELKDLMIGLGRVDPLQITNEIRKELQELGFYKYFEQAKELNY